MDQATLKALRIEHIGRMKEFLDLDAWTIFSASERLDGDRMATCETWPEYRKARIVFDKDAIEDDEAFVDILAHELFHIVLSPLEFYRKAVEASFQQHQDGHPILWEVCRQAQEGQVAALMAIWHSHLRDLYLERATA